MRREQPGVQTLTPDTPSGRLAGLADDVAGLLDTDWRDVGLVELGSDLVALARLAHQLDAVTLHMAAIFDADSGVAGYACASAGVFLATHTHTATGAGHRLVHTARALRDTFAATADALAAGRISLDHAHQIRRLAGLPDDARAQFEPLVLDVATAGTARDTRRAVDLILDACLGDAGDTSDNPRRFDIAATSNGWVHVSGLLTADVGQKLQALIADLSAKTSIDDVRTGSQRRHD